MASWHNALSRRDMLRSSAAGALTVSQLGSLAGCIQASPYADAQTRLDLIARLSALTIPSTDTLGAASQANTAFASQAIEQSLYSLEPRMLTEVGDWLDDVGGRRFLSQTTDKQTECLIKLDKSAFQDDSLPKKAGERAWSEIKPLIVASYYSSEVGASKELVYDPVPGKFENITLTDDYRAQSNEGHGEKW